MKMWKDMSPEEKGALLLAHHERKQIENYSVQAGWHTIRNPIWSFDGAYRVKPVPVIKQVVMYGSQESQGVWCFDSYSSPAQEDTHKIMFNLVDGEVDCFSVKMEKI